MIHGSGRYYKLEEITDIMNGFESQIQFLYKMWVNTMCSEKQMVILKLVVFVTGFDSHFEPPHFTY